MSSSSAVSDFNFFKSLWSRINDAVVRPPFPGDEATKECLLIEMPGFSINPDNFDVENFRNNPSGMSPACATAKLVDRVPALAHYFYDTGCHVSFYWKQFLETFVVVNNPEDDPEVTSKYEDALEVLYGGSEGYRDLKKSEVFDRLDKLRDKWFVAKTKLEEFKRNCQKKIDWPENFESHVQLYLNKEEDAFIQYNNLRSQIALHQAAIYQFTKGDLSTLLMHQMQVMGQKTLYDAGRNSIAAPFYETLLEPTDWWKWFKEDAKIDDDSESWTLIEIKQDELYESRHDTLSKVTNRDHIDSNFKGLFSSRDARGSNTSNKLNTLTSDTSSLTLSFKIRKVAIERPWMELELLQHSTIGIKGLKAGTWSTGELDIRKNRGMFPLLPTHFVVAKDVKISAHEDEENLSRIFSMASESSAEKMENFMGIGCFTLKGNHGFNEHSHSTKSEYDAETNTLTVKGAHIIGWICSVLPKFPAVSMDQPRPFERRRVRQRVQHKDTSKSCDKTHSSMPSDEQTHYAIMYKFDWPGTADDCDVFLSGSFNNWRNDVTKMDKNDDGTFSAFLTLFPGTYEYKFYVDSLWLHNPNQPTTVDGYGGLNNILRIEHDQSSAVMHKITWQGTALDCYSKIFLCGTFNNWKKEVIEMDKNDDGKFSASITVSPGVYEYKFCVDGQWLHDPNKPTKPDGFGGMNNILRVEHDALECKRHMTIAVSSGASH